MPCARTSPRLVPAQAGIGLVAAAGVDGLKALLKIIRESADTQRLSEPMRQTLQALVDQLAALAVQISTLEGCIQTQHRGSETSRRLETIPGIGVIGATAIAATVTDPSAFMSGRELAAWIGLVPRQHSTGGKQKLGGISKQGDRYLRRLLIVGATAVIRHARVHPDKHPWLTKLLGKMPAKKVAVALANKACPREGGDGADRLGHPCQGQHLSSPGACGSRLKGLAMGA